MKCFAALNKRETYTMAHIIYLLFRSKVQSFRFHTAESLADSRLFGTALSSGNSVKFDLLRLS